MICRMNARLTESVVPTDSYSAGLFATWVLLLLSVRQWMSPSVFYCVWCCVMLFQLFNFNDQNGTGDATFRISMLYIVITKYFDLMGNLVRRPEAPGQVASSQSARYLLCASTVSTQNAQRLLKTRFVNFDATQRLQPQERAIIMTTK